jgi:hypothetical protein
MQIISKALPVGELKKLATKMFGNLVKAVVDIEKQALAVDAELHADLEKFLIEKGSNQKNIWGINLHPENYGTEKFVEFDSMINIRPSQNNPSRGINDLKIQATIKQIIGNMITS